MNLLIITLLAGIFLFIPFAFHLFTLKEGNVLLNRLLGLLFLNRAIQSLYYLQAYYFHNFYLNGLIFLSPLATFLTPPLMFVYVRAFIYDENHFRKRDWLHFLPVISYFIFYVIKFLVDWFMLDNAHLLYNRYVISSENLQTQNLHLLLNIRVTYFLFYFLWVVKLFWDKRRKSSIQLNSIIRNWLIFFVSSLFMIHLVIFLSLNFLLDKEHLVNSYFQFGWVTAFTIMLTASFMIYIFKQPMILYGYLYNKMHFHQKEADNNLIESVPTESFSIPEEEKIGKSFSLLSQDQIDYYIESLNKCISAEKPYLDSELKLRELSSMVNIPEHHCSYLLNQVLNISFRDYINKLRVEHFINEFPRLSSSLTMESMANASGFKSKNTFYTAFKKETGKTPREYFSMEE